MYAGGGAKVTLEKACGMGLPEHYFRIFRLIFSNSFPPRVLWVRSLLLLPADAFSGIVRGYSRYAAGTVCRNALHYYNHIARKCRGWSIRCTLINPVHGADVLRWHCPCRRSQICGDRESEDDWDLSEASQPSCLYSMEAEDYCRSSYAMQPAHDREYPGTHSGFLLLIWRTEPAAGE